MKGIIKPLLTTQPKNPNKNRNKESYRSFRDSSSSSSIEEEEEEEDLAISIALEESDPFDPVHAEIPTRFQPGRNAKRKAQDLIDNNLLREKVWLDTIEVLKEAKRHKLKTSLEPTSMKAAVERQKRSESSRGSTQSNYNAEEPEEDEDEEEAHQHSDAESENTDGSSEDDSDGEDELHDDDSGDEDNPLPPEIEGNSCAQSRLEEIRQSRKRHNRILPSSQKETTPLDSHAKRSKPCSTHIYVRKLSRTGTSIEEICLFCQDSILDIKRSAKLKGLDTYLTIWRCTTCVARYCIGCAEQHVIHDKGVTNLRSSVKKKSKCPHCRSIWSSSDILAQAEQLDKGSTVIGKQNVL
ncbi:uncharacterized protein L201_001203 [Kwoniella dendrophila CBS 6074]|uniref:RING-type domain-containing protein n=1 Tax=Kwoniella dendrophila CBS 6074 TaxID=1295534 RepID=A0AAX4JP42_9TREE